MEKIMEGVFVKRMNRESEKRQAYEPIEYFNIYTRINSVLN